MHRTYKLILRIIGRYSTLRECKDYPRSQRPMPLDKKASISGCRPLCKAVTKHGCRERTDRLLSANRKKAQICSLCTPNFLPTSGANGKPYTTRRHTKERYTGDLRYSPLITPIYQRSREGTLSNADLSNSGQRGPELDVPVQEP